MTIARRAPLNLDQFLAWEETQDGRYEFDGFQPRAMTGGTVAHDRITFNLQKALDARLSGKPCRPFGPNVKIIAAGRVRYPDGIVTCSSALPGATVIDDPVVVFEVVSDDSARIDRIEKLREYQATPGIQRYVILEQKSIAAMVFTRRGDIWTAEALMEGDLLQMPEIEVAIPMVEFYLGLEFSRASDRSAPAAGN